MGVSFGESHHQEERNDVGSFGNRLGLILSYWSESFLSSYIGVRLGLCWDFTRVILGLYWDYIGVI